MYESTELWLTKPLTISKVAVVGVSLTTPAIALSQIWWETRSTWWRTWKIGTVLFRCLTYTTKHVHVLIRRCRVMFREARWYPGLQLSKLQFLVPDCKLILATVFSLLTRMVTLLSDTPHLAMLNIQMRWWASSSDTLIYPSIFAFPLLSLHCRSTTMHLRSDATAYDCTHARTTIALTSSDWSRLFDGHMTYDSHVFTSILSVSNVPPPAVWPITSSHTARSGTFYSFAICSHSCLPFVFNLPVFTFHQGRSLLKP